MPLIISIEQTRDIWRRAKAAQKRGVLVLVDDGVCYTTFDYDARRTCRVLGFSRATITRLGRSPTHLKRLEQAGVPVVIVKTADDPDVQAQQAEIDRL